jgi:hypothetical protein
VAVRENYEVRDGEGGVEVVLDERCERPIFVGGGARGTGSYARVGDD